MKKLALLAVLPVLMICCTPPPQRHETFIPATIPVVDERLSLSPLISEAHVEHLPDWPVDPNQQKVILKTFDQIWQRLQAEFRRHQKYGLYTMVEDDNNPTIRISIILTALEFINDTLSMPIRLQAERLRDDQRFIYTLPAIATVQPDKKSSHPYHYYGQLFSDYRRRFPYALLVSFFYRRQFD